MSTPPRRPGPDAASLFWGLLLVCIGLWFFAEQTLGIQLPTIRWDDLWPLILIGLGVIVLVRAGTRRT